MKHTLEEIEKMLADISPWPWEVKEYQDSPDKFPFWCIESKEKGEFGTTIIVDGNHDDSPIARNTDAFIASSPQIISDLVEEVKELKEALGRNITPDQLAKDTRAYFEAGYKNAEDKYLEENKRLMDKILRLENELDWAQEHLDEALEDLKYLENK